MSEVKRLKDLELEENMVFQAAEWAFEIIGTLAMFAIVALAFSGFFGRDPHSKTIAGTKDEPLWAEYERTAHWQTRTLLEIHATPNNPDKKAEISINDDYLRDMMVNQITPEPKEVEVKSDETTFTFIGSDSKSPVVVRFHMEPDKPGAKEARITLGQHAITFKQRVLP